jgi:hypothetical protein
MDEKRRIGNGLEMDWKWIGNGSEKNQEPPFSGLNS